jgi:DIS3-like exonuclease 2
MGAGPGARPKVGKTPQSEGRLHEFAEACKVAGNLVRWSEHSQMPMGCVTAVLGRVGSLEAETQAILHEFDVPSTEFPAEVFDDLPQGEALTTVDLGAPGGGLDAPRRDCRSWRICSIDPPTARDLVDALSIRQLENGNTEVGVHIADVTHYVVPGTSLDAEAASRSTSTYLIDGVIPMLPRPLCEHLCSLQPGVDRLAFSVTWEFNSHGHICNEWAGRSIIRSCGQLAYQNAYNLMQGKEPGDGDIKVPELHNGVTWEEIARDVKDLWRVGSQLRRKRFADGALALHRVKFGFKLDQESGEPVAAHHYKTNEANQLVEEFMLLANRTVARIIAEEFPDRALLRRHPPPDKKKLGDLASFAAKHGLNVDTRNSKALHESLQRARQTYRDQGLADVLVHFATKPMQLAQYFSCGMAVESDWPHYALAMERYTHFTSPIRRYADVVVHRMLAAALDVRSGAVEDHEAAIEKWRIHDCEDAESQARRCNERKEAAKAAQEASERLYLCLLLIAGKEGNPKVARIGEGGVNRFTDGLVVAVGSKFISVFLPQYSIESRCYLDDIHPDITATHDPQTFTVTLTGGPAGRGRTLRILDHVTVELHAVFPTRGPCQIRTTLLVGAAEQQDKDPHMQVVTAVQPGEDV